VGKGSVSRTSTSPDRTHLTLTGHTPMPPIGCFVWSGCHDQAVAAGVPGELAPHYAAGRRRGPSAAGQAGGISSGRSAGAFWS
jgi:hypothetical protein